METRFAPTAADRGVQCAGSVPLISFGDRVERHRPDDLAGGEVEPVHLPGGGFGDVGVVAADEQGRAWLLPLHRLLPRADHRPRVGQLAGGGVYHVQLAVGAEDQALALWAARQRTEAVADALGRRHDLEPPGRRVDERELLGELALRVRLDLVVAEQDRGLLAADLGGDGAVHAGALDLDEGAVREQQHAVRAAEPHDLTLRDCLTVDAGAFLAAGDLLAVLVQCDGSGAGLLGAEGHHHGAVGEFHGHAVVRLCGPVPAALRLAVGEPLRVEAVHLAGAVGEQDGPVAVPHHVARLRARVTDVGHRASHDAADAALADRTVRLAGVVDHAVGDAPVRH
ncbi:hypothetical protein [Micromonospora antibiotica]|uniref:Uncharacterized protein n=1 Tax=Micromonospora antibiotica TaxID=2807623 RepID=A0ABS3V6V6_9ACTN|nr:hypothetical protein [Micromonospora antibiotica]MBO4161330.1 hypothetical protein [Micromonospora antibiotica]